MPHPATGSNAGAHARTQAGPSPSLVRIHADGSTPSPPPPPISNPKGRGSGKWSPPGAPSSEETRKEGQKVLQETQEMKERPGFPPANNPRKLT